MTAVPDAPEAKRKPASPAGGVIVGAIIERSSSLTGWTRLIIGIVILSLGVTIGWNAALRMHPRQIRDEEVRARRAAHHLRLLPHG